MFRNIKGGSSLFPIPKPLYRLSLRTCCHWQLSTTCVNKFNMATTVVSAYAVSDYERTSYYNGITDEGSHPDLLHRTGSAKYSWIQPKDEHAYQPTKSLRGVFRTPLNDVWSTVGPQVRELVKDRKISHSSIAAARFVTHGEDGEETRSRRYLGWGLSRLYLRRHRPRSISEYP